MPPDVSSMIVRIGRRRLVNGESARLYSFDMNSLKSRRLKAQVSTDCWPWVLMTLVPCPLRTNAALPPRAGTTTGSDMAASCDRCATDPRVEPEETGSLSLDSAERRSGVLPRTAAACGPWPRRDPDPRPKPEARADPLCLVSDRRSS